jgi:NADH-quinone oxidoreductase subunit N
MDIFNWTQLSSLTPELFLLGSGILLLFVGTFGGNRLTDAVRCGTVIAFAFSACMLDLGVSGQEAIFGGMAVVDGFTQFSKLLILIAAILSLLIAGDWLRQDEHRCFEFPVLMLLSVVGLMLMVSAGNLLTFYLGLELSSLALYVLAAFKRDDLKSTEAGLKYFVLGALASGMLLFGMSLVYGFAGTTSFSMLGALFTRTHAMAAASPEMMLATVSPGVTVGLILIMIGLFFKISAVPFHMWTPDVYEGAPTPVVAFFSSAPKIAAIALFIRVLMQPFIALMGEWQQIIIVVSIASMLVGALGALWQTNIKRLLAYSSIGHVGYILVGLAAGTISGVEGALIYLTLYLFMTIGAFACVLMMRRQGQYVEAIDDLAGLSKTSPGLAALFAVFMFSMAGIPPLAGFFGKLFVFKAAIEAGLVKLAVTGVLTSVIACFYYLKIIKVMYFDEAKEAFDKQMTYGIRVVMMISLVVTLGYIIFPGALLRLTHSAALALLL